MTVTSEMLGGVVKIDGHTTLEVGMGDRFFLEINPANHLRCVQLIL